MNTTKTLRLPPRRLIASSEPSVGPNSKPNVRPKKRKEIVGLDEAHQLSLTAKLARPPPPTESNQLLAGYLAHEFLANGTLFGQPWDQPGSVSAAEPTGEREAEPELQHKNYQSYVEVSNLFKHRGAHFQGIVNPTQLASLLNL